MATLADLGSIRSQRALRWEAHLRWLADGTPWQAPPWHRRAGAPSPDSVYVPPDVRAHDPQHRPKDTDDEVRAAAFGRDDRDRTRWDRVWSALTERAEPGPVRVAVLGRPGEGKTTLAQRTCRELAAKSLARWDSRTVPLDQIPIPLWLTAAQVIAAESVPGALSTAAVAPGGRRTERAAVSPHDGLDDDELAAALASLNTWVFIDALDEGPRVPGLGPDAIAGRTRDALRGLGGLGCNVLVTVRTYAWHTYAHQLPFRVSDAPGRESIVVYEVATLDDRQRKAVVESWHPSGGEPRAQLLTLLDVAPMRELTNNALLLTLLCSAALVPGRTIGRQTRRAELYAWLAHDMVAREDKTGHVPGDSLVRYRVGLLERAAWLLWSNACRSRFHQDEWVAAIERAAMCAEAGPQPADLADRLESLHACVETAGLLVKDGPDERRFFPQTLFEYLAGAGLTQQAALGGLARDPMAALRNVADTLVREGADSGWREVFTLAVGHLCVVRHKPAIVDDVMCATMERLSTTSSANAGGVLAVVAEGLIEAGERDERLPKNLTGGLADPIPVLQSSTRARLCELLLATMRNAEPPGAGGHVPAVVRARAGAALGWIGDPRFDPKAFWLPRLTEDEPYGGFVWIPAGRFLMGGPERRWSDPPPPEVTVGHPFMMARWQVTVAQWATYLADSGLQSGHSDSLLDPPTAPVRFVSANDAEAYCAWLTTQLAGPGPLSGLGAVLAARFRGSRGGASLFPRLRRATASGGVALVVRLPTEDEWEYVAKGGPSGRPFRYGSAFDPDATNSLETGIRMSSAVGSFRRGAARLDPADGGVEGLSADVGEWTSSPALDSRGAEVDSWRVVRGGAFYDNTGGLRHAYRLVDRPTNHYNFIGLRLVVSRLRS